MLINPLSNIYYMYTLDYSRDQLDRLYSYIDSGQPIKIIHILWNDQNSLEDRYIVLLECPEATYTLLLML